MQTTFFRKREMGKVNPKKNAKDKGFHEIWKKKRIEQRVTLKNDSFRMITLYSNFVSETMYLILGEMFLETVKMLRKD